MSITWEEAADTGCIELLLCDSRGIYIPRDFCECFEGWQGFGDCEVRDCLEGPDNEHYWDSWDTILDDARYIDPKTGNEWYLYQDGDLFAVRADVDIDWDSAA